MRTLSRFVGCLAVLGILAVGGYLLFTNVPALRDIIDGASRQQPTQSPTMPTEITDPTEIAALPTSIPPATAPPSALPPTPSECVEAAAVTAGGDSVRTGPPAQAQGLARGRGLPGGQRANVNFQPGRLRNRVLIEFTPDSTRSERAAYIRSISGRASRTIDRLNTVVVALPNDVEPPSLPPSPIVISVQGDYPVAATFQVESNDPLFADQWALPIMGVPAVWPALPANTPPVTVAVIDSGVCLSHPDLAGRLVAGWDFIDDDDTPEDAFGHGCGVAGVIAANGDNGVGIAGVAPNARIMPLRVLDSRGIGSFSDVAAAIVYATDSGANVINLSLAGPATTGVVGEAVAYAASRGVVLVGAAGNGGLNEVWYPAAYDGVIAVGSVDATLAQSDFSNFGEQVDLFAPGRDIYTTGSNGEYLTMTGTSFAAPQVAGIVALAMAFNTSLRADGGLVFITPPQDTRAC